MSHRSVKYSIDNIYALYSSNLVEMTDGIYASHGEHCIIYRIVHLPCYTPKTNITLYVSYALTGVAGSPT